MAAIYIPQWPKPIELTTTLYPVVALDSMNIVITLDGGYMALIPVSDAEVTYNLQNGTYTQIYWLLTDGPYTSDAEITYNLQNGTYTQIYWLLADGPYPSDAEVTYAMLAGTYTLKGVIGDSPDEKLQMSILIDNASTMEAI